MEISKLVALAITLTTLAAATGQLSKVIIHVQRAQIELLKHSQSDSWGHPYLLPTK